MAWKSSAKGPQKAGPVETALDRFGKPCSRGRKKKPCSRCVCRQHPCQQFVRHLLQQRGWVKRRASRQSSLGLPLSNLQTIRGIRSYCLARPYSADHMAKEKTVKHELLIAIGAATIVV